MWARNEDTGDTVFYMAESDWEWDRVKRLWRKGTITVKALRGGGCVVKNERQPWRQKVVMPVPDPPGEDGNTWAVASFIGNQMYCKSEAGR